MRSKTRKHNTNKTRKIPLAGEAIAAGGFGCVFRPAINCDTQADRAKQKQHNYISKIMKNRYANEEMVEVNRFLPVIKTIPNNKKYFLLDGIFKCRPGKLTSSDKKNLNVKCGNLSREGISESNINNNLSRIQSLNIPDGGVAVRKTMEGLAVKFVRGDKEQQKRFGHLNNSLIRTLKNAIVPMNNKGIIHCDLKGDNMLVNAEKLTKGEPYVKVIDWGLGDKFNPSDKTTIPAAVRDRPIQFNAPWGVILFDKKTIGQAKSSMSLTFAGESVYKILAYKIIEKSNAYSAGHTAYLTQYLFPDLSNPFIKLTNDDKPEGFSGTSSSDIKKTLFANGIIVTHIQRVLEKYYQPSTRTFNESAYFHEVYRWNVDVWGFLMAYIELLTKAASNSYSRYRDNYPLQMLANIVYKYCLSGNYAAERIPVNKLIKELQDVSKEIKGFKSKGVIEDTPKINMAALRKMDKEKRKKEKAAQKKKKEQTKKKKKMKLKLKAKSPKGLLISIPVGKKRCPNGYVKDVPTGKCRKKGTKKASKKAKATRKVKKTKATRKALKNVGTNELFDTRFRVFNSGEFRGLIARDKTRKRCPKGFKKLKEHGGYLVCAKK